MDSELEAAQASGDWPAAIARASSLGYADTTWLRQARWLALDADDDGVTADLLAGINDSHWVATAVLQRVVSSADREKQLLDVGLDAADHLDHAVSSSAYFKRALLQLRDRLRTYEELYAGPPAASAEEDPWEADLALPDDEPSASSVAAPATSQPLKPFLARPLPDLIHEYAAQGDTRAVRALLRRHAQQVAPSDRLALVDLLPLHLDPLDYLDLLPLARHGLQAESWRQERDWSEVEPSEPGAADEAELSKRFRARIEAVEAETGMVELALALVQHGAARGITGLEALGEELSLLSSLVYDRPPAMPTAGDDDWTLQRWRTASPDQLVSAYLAHSSADTIVDDVQRLVRPLLFVLESRNERAGHPDPALPTRLLYHYILSAPLPLVRSLVSASKPTLPASRRVIKDDADLARLALACLYGSSDVEAWLDMSAIFECLPAFTGITEAEQVDASAFTSHLASSASAPDPATLFAALANCSPSALTSLLDGLDIHLDSGETLAKWGAPQPLRWLVSAAENESEQRRWLLRLVRRGGAQAENEDDWVVLMEDACRLATPGAAFATLNREEVLKLFFEALLSSGRFSLAKSLLNPSTGDRPLDPEAVHELVLKASRDFYDNAESGNLNIGNMKLAIECLTVAPQSPAIRREREFIEATSRLCSFKLPDQPAPIEIRLASDKLALVGRLLEQHADAYRHPDVILELVKKLLGTCTPTEEIRTLGMIVDAALRHDEPAHAADACDRLVDIVPRAKGDADAVAVAWRRCFAVGTAPAFADVDRRLKLLGRAMLLAPAADVTTTLLPAWRLLDRNPRSAASTSLSGPQSARTAAGHQLPASSAVLSGGRAGTEAAARAARSLGKAAAGYLRPLTPSGEARAGAERSPSPGPPHAMQPVGAEHYGRFGVRSTLSKGFTQGVGWLIGAEVDEHGEGPPA